MKVFSTTVFSIAMMFAQPVLAQGDVQIPGQQQEEEAPTPTASLTAETRALQAIHLSNLTQFAAQLIGVAKLPDDTGKQLAWNHAKNYGQWEGDLIKLAFQFKVNLISDQPDIIAIKEKNNALLQQLVDAPKDATFKDTFNNLIWAEQGALGEFLDKENKVGFTNPEVQTYVDTIIGALQKPE